ncbi:hypothetical protein Pst134EA_000146 [Puccinia striiformis f. sp. tritici]|uniref:hypothetical protein n=1 Tax=Puccinia striiformis f. sp. tritici TaxID=168172 RepID=UPI002008193A|nr:hypothetical protein Pst134EA_000146 [Puccinia striiformis f. sp. tritici]KAH9473067.1 hypothetical protein Pst134EA_000146 [Puccinia striiformis f. sp. tritici]KAI9601606.1 hypothetical protein H4Q26_001437 [Puccinia striiformis f. sp. tritici PST-130]
MNTPIFILVTLTICLTWVEAQSNLLLQEDRTSQPNVFSYSGNATSEQLRNDALRVVEQFASALGNSTSNSHPDNSKTVTLFKNAVHGAMSYQLYRNVGNSTQLTETKLQSMSTAINDTLNSINDVTDQLLSSANGALRFADLRNCLSNLVQQGGLKDGESCVIQGLSITGVSEILTSVLQNFGDGILPPNILELTAQALDPVFTSLIPGEEQFFSAIEGAIASVQRAIAGALVQALDDAFRCFKSTIFLPISYEERLSRTRECNRDSAASHSSVFRDLKTLYLSITNQFVGYVTPNVLESIHSISDAYLQKGVHAKPEEKFFRNAISNAVKSIVASNSGNEVIYAYKIADCLDTVVGVVDPDTAANKAATAHCLEKPDGPPAALRQIIYGYIQQIYGVLPVAIAEELEQLGIMNLDRSSPNFNHQVNELHQKFLKTNPGPEYVSCYERLTDCLFNPQVGGILAPSSNKTQLTCLLGRSCQNAPDGKQIPFIQPESS